MYKFVIIYLFLVSLSLVTCAKFPSQIQKCVVGDTQCVKTQMNEAIRLFSTAGNAGLNLVKFDPLHIDSLQIVQGGESPINIVLDFKNVDWSGLGKAEITKVGGFSENPDNVQHLLKMKAPRFVLAGDYKINGRILVLPIQGEGKSNLTMDNIIITYKFTTKTVERNAKVYADIVKTDVSFTTSRLYMNFGNLFNGDKALGDNMNKFLNENWEDILNELKPNVAEAFGEIITNVLNLVFARRPYKELFQTSR